MLLLFLFISFSWMCCDEKSNDFSVKRPLDSEKNTDEEPEKPIIKPGDTYAFPGIEGGGKHVTGGRGGKVLKVTSLADDGSEGTFRWAINQSGARYIVFDISGTIFLNDVLNINNGDLTIAGQSAPGDGICVAGFPVNLKANNIVIRFLRFRMGNINIDKLNADGADAINGRDLTDLVIDHCSISWSTDECASFYDNKNFTMQWCIVSESLRLAGHSKGSHGYGAMWGGFNATFHHNLLAHHDSRTPRFCGGAHAEEEIPTEYCNNVTYNWSQNGCYGAESMLMNIRNNYYKPGTATPTKSMTRILGISPDSTAVGGVMTYQWGKYYVEGNYFHNHSNVTEDNWQGMDVDDKYNQTLLGLKQEVPFTTASLLKMDDAETAYKKVLATAGCSYSRDALDTRIVEEVKAGITTYKGLSPENSGSYPRAGIIDSQDDIRPANAPANWSAWPTLKSERKPLDADGDGIPDDWEIAMELDPTTNDANGHDLSIGYDNIEVYLNWLVQDIVELETY